MTSLQDIYGSQRPLQTFLIYLKKLYSGFCSILTISSQMFVQLPAGFDRLCVCVLPLWSLVTLWPFPRVSVSLMSTWLV